MGLGGFYDIEHFVKKLSWKKAVAGASLLGGYYYSRISRKPRMTALPVSIAIEPTTSCNLRCPQCPSGLRQFSRPTGMIDKELFFHIIDQIKETVCYLTFYFQGEPYLHPDFPEMARYAEEKGIYTSTSTNAHYLNEETARKTVESGLSRLIVSMDGLDQETYAKYRVGGQLHKVVEGLKTLTAVKRAMGKKRPYLILQYLVLKHNEGDLQKVERFAKTLGVDEVKFKTAQIYDYENGSEFIPDTGQYARYRKTGSGYAIKNRMYNHCWKMWHSCVITWDGKVVPCCFDKDASHVLGDMKEQSFKEIWFSKRYGDFRSRLFRSRKNIDICRNCTEGTKVWI